MSGKNKKEVDYLSDSMRITGKKKDIDTTIITGKRVGKINLALGTSKKSSGMSIDLNTPLEGSEVVTVIDKGESYSKRIEKLNNNEL